MDAARSLTWPCLPLVNIVERALDDIHQGRLQRTFGTLTAAAALASGFEAFIQHLRGAYDDWLMWTPLVLTPPVVAAGVGTALDARVARASLPWLSAALIIDGVVGFAAHLRGIHRLPGGFRFPIYNTTMGPPVFAPLFFVSVGILGLLTRSMPREQSLTTA